jgi:transcriptional regulator with XRE-family HTH domain
MENRLKDLRLALDLTQEALADRVGTSPQQIARLERGERKLTHDWMQRLAPALGVDVPALISTGDVVLPKVGDQIQDREELELIHFWRKLTSDQKRLLHNMLKNGPPAEAA